MLLVARELRHALTLGHPFSAQPLQLGNFQIKHTCGLFNVIHRFIIVGCGGCAGKKLREPRPEPREKIMKKTLLSILLATAASVAFGQGQGELTTTTTTTTTVAGQADLIIAKQKPAKK